ncbi:MAG: hypothetical protein K1X92_10440 [Bacteroidia bacterium]|nr:hypothetical protein [Bacteroidia bacterium]
MKMKSVRILLLLLLAPFFNPFQAIAKGLCAWDGPMANSIFWSPELTYNNPDFRPFLFSFDRLYEYKWAEPEYLYRDNSAEWVDYCSMRASRAEVDSFVYNSTVSEMEAVLTATKSGKLVSGKFKDNTMAKYLNSNRDINALEYLVYAKKCEVHATSGYYDPWEEAPPKNIKVMRQLYQEGQKSAEKATKPILKLRYAYQAVRLAHYAGDFSQAIGTYDNLIAPLNIQSVVKYWAMGNKAGALLSSGKRAEALYLFSQVFEKCPTKRVQMYYSFRPQSDDEWSEVMNLCSNNREKSTLHLIRAIHPHAQTIEEMKSIYVLDPQSDYLTLLLIREINKLETSLMDYEFDFKFPIPVEYKNEITDDGSKMSGEYLYTFKKFVSAKVAEKKVKDLRAWQLAEGYLMFLTGEFQNASRIMESLSDTENNPKTKSQIRSFLYLLKVSQMQSIDRGTEESMYNEYLNLGLEKAKNEDNQWEVENVKTNVYNCMLANFSRCYERKGETGKAFLCKKGIKGLFSNTDVSIVDNILKWAVNPSTSFEKHLLEKEFNDNGISGTDVLWDIKGTYYLRKGELSNAKAAYERTSVSYRENQYGYFQIHFNPFESFINDRHDEAETRYGTAADNNKLWLVNKMAEMEEEAGKNTQKAAENYFKLGNAWYNISYFGPGWRALAYSRSGSDLFYFDMDGDEYISKEFIESQKASLFYNMNPAISYYEKALNQKPAPELGAKIQFGMAKCKLNQTYTRNGNAQAVYQEYEQLKKSFAGTRYYAEIIRECSYFKNYINK